MQPLETYLSELRAIRSTGGAVKETSYYPALISLLNEVGSTLKPKVRCILNPQNQGAGIPDVGLYEATQLERGTATPITGKLPARGCVEVKGTAEDVAKVAASKQVRNYLSKYRQVLVTNYRSFLLLAYDANNNPVTLETYDLAESETAFWTAQPRALAQLHGARFVEYLKRVMLHAAELVEPEQVAWFLASYARDAKARIEGFELPALANVRRALEEALGLRFEGEKGEQFFRSTLVQTLFYGVFSAWVLWCKQQKDEGQRVDFRWREAVWLLHVPMIKALFYQIASPQTLGQLGLVEVLDWTAAVLNRVRRAEFFARFEEGQAVQYFYEPFLQNFDPELRKQLGVWYTPTEIVQYMVARVDTVLREELNITDGLADERMYVLDPCCGTGAYLVEVLRHINATLEAREGEGLSGHYLKEAATKRVFGFEILPAPFVVAHLQLGLLLQNLGTPLSDATDERAGVYLTNALTGWEPATEPKTHLLFPELEAERDAAEKVKRDTPILVILGNPPYNAFAGTSPEEEQGLVEPYKAGLIKEWGIKKFNLDDLYVRFFRLAERRIAQKEGVICYISNFSYLSDPSFVVVRQRFLAEFDKLWFDSLNGDSRETGKLTPEGKPDPSVFSTEYNREGIRVGTAIGLMVRKEQRDAQPTVRFRQFWGVTKRADLLTSLRSKNIDAQYDLATPSLSNRYSFRSSDVGIVYLSWPSLTDLCAIPPITGYKENRGFSLIDSNKKELEERMRKYFDPDTSWQDLKALGTGLTEDAARFDAQKARDKVLRAEQYDSTRIMRYVLRPFELRWCYYCPVRPLWNEPRPSLFIHQFPGNAFLVSRPAGVANPEGVPFYFTGQLGDFDFMRGHSYHFPLRLNQKATVATDDAQHSFFSEQQGFFTAQQALTVPTNTTNVETTANLSPTARAYLASLGIINLDVDSETAALVWMHALAIGYAPAYLAENADGIRGDWPRIPLPADADALRASAALGRRVAALLDTEHEVAGVTTGAVDSFLNTVAVPTRIGGGKLNPNAGELQLNAGWGHAGKGGVTMPGKGRLTTRPYSPAELAARAESPLAIQLTDGDPDAQLGATTHDVYLNDVAYWQNVPARVWDYTIGGYQVIKKWLSYREHELLGRDLTPEEVREVRHMARRIAALCLLEPLLDANYAAIKAAPYAWPAA
ncbi:MAG TPA: type ISP restriction/modification enzyme [Pyrinomonadaceae bacterium]|jgi:hypothetical protein